MRLWELEGGDGAEVDHGFAGGLGERPARGENHDEIPIELIVPPDAEPEAAPDHAEAARPAPLDRPFAREGPLVLRIGQIPPRAPAQPQPQQANRDERPVGVPRRLRGAADRRAAAHAPRERQVPNNNDNVHNNNHVQRMEEAQQRWVQNFVQMALNDEEDLIEDGDEEDDVGWEIPVR